MPTLSPMQTISIGSIKITFVPDGLTKLNATATYPTTSEEDWKPYVQFTDGAGSMVSSIGGYLIQTGDHNIVIDLGMSPEGITFPGFGSLKGQSFLDNFDKTGVSRDSVDMVFLTHMHLDHVGWAAEEGGDASTPSFPKAQYICIEAEWNTWAGGDNPAGPSLAVQQPIFKSNLRFVEYGDVLAENITVINSAGHTPGHASLMIEVDGKRLCIAGDVIHGKHQLDHPEWVMAFDALPEVAIATRRRLFAELAQTNTIIAFNHFADGVFGRLTATDDGYSWETVA